MCFFKTAIVESVENPTLSDYLPAGRQAVIIPNQEIVFSGIPHSGKNEITVISAEGGSACGGKSSTRTKSP